jgi:deoxyribodipyrimidine photo-lyase
MMGRKNIVWHRRDLRTTDNKALKRAAEHGEAYPVFVIDPEFFEGERMSCDARIQFMFECLEDLNRQYQELGSNLAILFGNSVERLQKLSKSIDAEVYYNYDTNMPYGFERDQKAAEKGFKGFQNDAVRRKAENPRDGWREHTFSYFNSPKIEEPEKMPENLAESDTTISEVKEKYGIEPEKTGVPEGGSRNAWRRLENFMDDIDQYSGSISEPYKAEKKTSQLSPYLSLGAISVREAYQRAGHEESYGVELFQERLIWNQHFTQKLEDNSDLIREAVNPVYRDLNKDKRDEELIKAWKSGETGYPLVDASMRALNETGDLNFRMRAMVASFFSYILKQWWKTGADYMHKQLIDADAAINYAQWQMQSGLVGVHANRIYDPTKQVEENDSEGKFIRKYVPELRKVPDEHLAEPWKMPEKLQKQKDVIVGEDYPEPVVDYSKEADEARRFFERKAPAAYKALLKDEVWRKASLSQRHDKEEIRQKAGEAENTKQGNLDQFT